MQDEDRVLYKWLLTNGESPVQNCKWPLEIGEWSEPRTPVICRSGWHGVYEEDVLRHLPQGHATLWVVETKGEFVKGDDKFAAAQMRLVHPLGTTDDRNLRLFACDVAQDVLPVWKAFAPDDTTVEYCITVQRRYAVGEATLNELSAAESAARSAAESAARSFARSFARSAARSAAWGAAESAALIAAWIAAGSAAWIAARSAARSAALDRYSNWLVVRLESDF